MQIIKLKNLLIIGAVLLIALSIIIIKLQVNKNKILLFENEKQYFLSASKSVESKVLIQSDGDFKWIILPTGEVRQASRVDKGNFSDFSGLPYDKVMEQDSILESLDKSQVIVAFLDPGDNESQINYYICNIAQGSCKNTDIFNQNYQGIDSLLQKENSSIKWLEWDSNKNLIFGYLLPDNEMDASIMYVCNTQEKICEKTDEIHTVIPRGSFSPSLKKFVMVSQNDKPNIETGGKWDLMIFDAANFIEPERSYDISSIIDKYEFVAYDSVQSVAWSQDEKLLVIGTSRRIFMLNLDSGGLSLVYVDPIDEEGGYYWDTDSLYLTPDAKFVTFIDSEFSFDNSEDEDLDISEESLDILKQIDVGNNQISSIYTGRGLRLKN